MSINGDSGIKNVETQMIKYTAKAYIVTGEDEDGKWWLNGTRPNYSGEHNATRFSYSERGKADAEKYAAKKGGRVEEISEQATM